MSMNDSINEVMNDTQKELGNGIINRILEENKDYGRSNYGNGNRINIVYSTIGDVNTIIGDSLSRIISFMGYNVTREYFAVDDNIDRIKNYLDGFRVNFDVFTTKKSLCDDGIVDKTLLLLQKSDKCYIHDDALWLKTGNVFDTTDRMLVDSDGFYTDLLEVISYHVDRFNRGNDILIDVIKKDDKDFISALKSGIEIAGYDFKKVGVIVIDNETFDSEIIDKMNVNALRYFVLSKLDMIIATERMAYIDSVNTKMCQILRNKTGIIDDKSGTIDNDTAYTILNKLVEFEKIVKKSSSGKLDIICDYLYDLACFSYKYYNEEDKVNYNLIEAIIIVMNNASDILGLILREKI